MSDNKCGNCWWFASSMSVCGSSAWRNCPHDGAVVADDDPCDNWRTDFQDRKAVHKMTHQYIYGENFANELWAEFRKRRGHK